MHFFTHLLEEHRTLSKTPHGDAECNIIIRKPVYSINILLASICHRDIQTVNISVDTNFCCRFKLLHELPWGSSKMARASHNYRRKKIHKQQPYSQQITLLFHPWLLIADCLLCFFLVRWYLTQYPYTNMLLISCTNSFHSVICTDK